MFGRKNPEVLVVGAGPVGLLTALALRERGKRVAVVDREWRTGTRSYACALHAEELGLLEDLGLLPKVLEGARRVRKVGVHDRDRRRADMRIADLAEDHSFLAVQRQEDLERVLVEALHARGVDIGWNRQVGRIETFADHVGVSIEELSQDTLGYAVQHSEWVVTRTRRMEVPFVIGADGYFSAVRRGLDIAFPEVASATHFAVWEFKTDADLGDEMRLCLNDDTTELCWPLPGGFCRWSFQQKDLGVSMDSRDKDREIGSIDTVAQPLLTEAMLRELLRERAPWFLGSVESIRWRMMVRFEARLAASFGRGRTWIVGDAAHLTGPAGIQSMNVGMREGILLADLIAQGAEPSACAEFDAARRAEWRALLGVDRALSKRASTDPWIAARIERLLPCIPASGQDLARLCDQLGFDAKMPHCAVPAHR